MKRKNCVTFETNVVIQIKNMTFKVLSQCNKILISMSVKCVLLVTIMIFYSVNGYTYVMTWIVDKMQRKSPKLFLLFGNKNNLLCANGCTYVMMLIVNKM